MGERATSSRLGQAGLVAALLLVAACASAPRGAPSGLSGLAASGVSRADYDRFRTALATSRSLQRSLTEGCADSAALTPEESRFLGSFLAVPEDQAREALCERFFAAIGQGRLSYEQFTALGRGADAAVIGEVVRILLETRPGEIRI